LQSGKLGGVNSIGKMGRDQWAYYQDQVALGREDYYMAGAARPGRWQGRGYELLGLSGQVRAEDVARVFNGLDPRHPQDERQLIDDPRWKVPGYDLTFMAAKSVSVLWAMSDADTRRRIDRALDRANGCILAWLEDKIGYGRTTAGQGQTVRVRGRGLTVATYAHSISRNLDPHLHRHNLILNAVERPNSRGVPAPAGNAGCLSPRADRRPRRPGFAGGQSRRNRAACAAWWSPPGRPRRRPGDFIGRGRGHLGRAPAPPGRGPVRGCKAAHGQAHALA
jgi:hypothetical protein